MVPMTWDINSCNQGGTKGIMTVVDRKNRTIFGTPAMQGIRDVYPEPSVEGVEAVRIGQTHHADAVYDLQGRLLVTPGSGNVGIVVSHGRKMLMR